jgi:hypothetical protein
MGGVSSNGLYNLIDPESPGFYCSGSSGEAWVFIEFRQSIVSISEIEVRSGPAHFPRSFDLIMTSTGGQIVRKEIRDADLNGRGKSAKYCVGEISLRSLKIEQKGPNWESGRFLAFGAVEMFSACGKSAVFDSLFRTHRNEIRELIGVTARDFNVSELHSISPRTNVADVAANREWVEFDFADHRLFVHSYRLTRARPSAIRSWSLIGSNDRTRELEDWTLLDLRYERLEIWVESVHIFSCFGGPFRYFRLVSESPRTDSRTNDTLWDVELFGALFPADVRYPGSWIQ